MCRQFMFMPYPRGIEGGGRGDTVPCMNVAVILQYRPPHPPAMKKGCEPGHQSQATTVV